MNSKISKSELEISKDKTINDLLKSNLKILFCGINPGLYSSATGFHFARPGNRFWKVLYLSKFTSKLLHPSEQRELLRLGYGITNEVSKTTAKAQELSLDEMKKGSEELKSKVLNYNPKLLAILGIDTYKKAFEKPKTKLGLQNEKIGSTQIWNLPNTSGLNAHYKLEDFVNLFKELKEYSDKL